MEPSDGTLHTIARHLVLALQPLKEAVADLPGFRTMLYRLGWDVKSLPPEYTALTAQVDQTLAALDGLGDDPTPAQIFDVLNEVEVLYTALTGITSIPEGVNAEEFLPEIGQSLFELLLADYLNEALPSLHSALLALDILTQRYVEETDTRPGVLLTRFQWEEIPKVITDPGSIPVRVYGWGTDDLDFHRLAGHLLEIFVAANWPAYIGRVDRELSRGFKDLPDDVTTSIEWGLKIPVLLDNIGGEEIEVGIALLELPAQGGKPAGLILQPLVPAAIGTSFDLTDELKLELRAGSDVASTFGVLLRPGDISVKFPFQEGAALPQAGFGVTLRYAPESPALLGAPGKSRLELKGMVTSFKLDFRDGQLEVRLEIALQELALVIAANDGFLHRLIGDGEKKLDFSLTVEWSNRSGIKFTGGGGFEVATHPHLSLGPITIDDILIRLLGKTDPQPAISLETGANIRGTLGPLVVVVQNMGLSMNLLFDSGNAGPFDIQLGFKPPNGAGLSIDSGVIKGGGFLRLDPDKGEYMGALELEFEDMFSLKAIGMINTKMPDGSNGFSLLIIITADFTPIQLGFGFTLMGVGGLLGLNRTTRIDILREGIKTNALKSILFPEDVVANINRIVSDITQVFPPRRDHFIIGPMAKIVWGTPAIITLEVGLLLEIPEPRIVILGVLRALLPDEDSELLKLQINFLGVIDFPNKYISFDASLYDSRLLAYTLTGDMAFRLSWGDHPLFILSVGGFHPAFKDVPADLQHMTRLTISLLSGQNPRITIQCYFAVTSNTVQFGAKAELYAAAAGFNIYGFVGFDVLFQFDPFHFIAELYAGLALRRGTSVVMGIKLHGELSGPTPWDVRGKASISILFFDITVSFHETWGDPAAAIASEVADLLALLSAEVNDIRNWKADVPGTNNLHVSIKAIIQPADKLVVHPFGVLTFSERLLPLQILIDKFGNQLPKDVKQFELTDIKSNTTALSSDPVKEQFAPAQFFELTDDMKLARPSFEPLTSGFKIAASGDLKVARPVNRSVNYELAYLRKKRFSFSFAGIYTLTRGLFKTATKGSAVSKTSLSHLNNRISSNAPQAVHVKPLQYGIANISDLQLHSSELVAESYAEVASMYQQLIERQPQLKDQLQILSSHEYETVQP